ncbi:hypothetical protein [Methylomonas albis]|uniref:Uncharacterized protein n=1 Tax=Methylomonas albis TaxID=1854563 RepID=A0ABR9D6J5_9GAMM|nr:hypothetical protein [Methylomonas albis]MBD9358742.1 hypothetical protein [Methylomonas albis]CAD6882195.1 hypothetical protein [Methylomonas albis]
MRFFTLLLALLFSNLAQAQQLTLTFPGNLPVTRSPISTIPMCEVLVSGYAVDVTMLGANLAGTSNTCIPANVLPAVDAGKVTAGKYGTSPAVGAQVAINPPSGITFDVSSVSVNDYGVGNTLTAYANYPDGTYFTYPIPYAAGVSTVTLPAEFAGMVKFEIYSLNNRIAVGDIVINDSTPVTPVQYTDNWVGNGIGNVLPIDPGATTANGGVIQVIPYGTNKEVVYTSASLSFTLLNPVFVVEKSNTVHPGVTIVTATGSTTDQNGTPITVSIKEAYRQYKQRNQMHYGLTGGNLTVDY